MCFGLAEATPAVRKAPKAPDEWPRGLEEARLAGGAASGPRGQRVEVNADAGR